MNTNINQIIGEIQEVEFKNRFDVLEGAGEFAESTPEATHRIAVNTHGGMSYGFRAAKILKTVAYVAVDENENGIVWEKWSVKWLWSR